jgi:hypothetical protein
MLRSRFALIAFAVAMVALMRGYNEIPSQHFTGTHYAFAFLALTSLHSSSRYLAIGAAVGFEGAISLEIPYRGSYLQSAMYASASAILFSAIFQWFFVLTKRDSAEI